MVLSDNVATRQVIGCLMLNPLLFLEYPDLYSTDFDNKVARICFLSIKNLYDNGATKLTPIEVDQEISQYSNSAAIYNSGNGLDLLKEAYEFATLSNFELYYNRFKKYSLLRRLHKSGYDISKYYKENIEIDDPKLEAELQKNFDEASIEEILNNVEGNFNLIREEFLRGKNSQGNPAEGIFELIDELQKAPNMGPSIEGKIFSSACRGARPGCFYLKSSSSGSGKTRTSIFDACHIAYPVRWSHDKQCFIREITNEGEEVQPEKVLFIVTEMDKEELQTIMLAYLSGVNEAHILTGKYEEGELSRVKYAAKIIKEYKDYFFIEEISEPDLTNVEATIKKYATIDNIHYVFFDYIHSTANMISQFERSGINEASILMMMANQLKQLAKDYNIFISSATQVNMGAMSDDGEFKNETNIRSSKAVADKADVGCVMTKIGEKTWNSLKASLMPAARDGRINIKYLENEDYRPTHIIDIYKMRRGRYKNVRIWTHLDLGNGYRNDLFMTTADNSPISNPPDLFVSAKEEIIRNWKERLLNGQL